MINPGELNGDSLIIQVKEEIENDYGYPEFTFRDSMTLKCKKKTISTRDMESNASPYTQYTQRFLCFYRKNVDSNMYIYYKDERYDIVHIHEIRDNGSNAIQFMEITASRSV